MGAPSLIHRRIDSDLAELVFRLLFSSIFIVLGGEHVFRDELIQQLMPPWMPSPRLFSVAAGVLLLTGGASIALGFRMHIAAIALGVFLVVVTLLIHVPGMLAYPPDLPPDWQWLWDLYQRSNFIKNVCLLGVCFHFLYHEPGFYSLDRRLSDNGA
ncbi:MAG: DoxX family protein [Deltaproteobacteria bacterium]|nr:DoxX family protein [Deltaproteobacteria bacterium]